ncbi:MAG: uroporphyrinogen decarboxylase [Gammaproteobacteria bacterium]|nr:uroporphyrinogen decarboxylase [Gammaproteobacteria bacterium]
MAEPLRNDRLLRALRRQPVDRPPVWLMRQAGRYLPEYRAVRERAGDFMTLCRTRELACEVTLQPVERFDLDAAILFSDILTVPDAMGLGLHFVEGEGPAFARPLRSAAEIRALPVPDPESELRYVLDAVRTIKRALAARVPLIGFAGSPWTLACYMLEGGGSREFVGARRLRFERPALLAQLLDTLTTAVARYLAAQAAAGADALMLFDTWGGLLDAEGFRRFSLAPLQRLTAELAAAAPGVPLIVFSKGAGTRLSELAATGCAGLGVDWSVSLTAARAAVADGVALQGNLDPTALLANPRAIRERVAAVLKDYGDAPGHVFNLGHGILPATPPEHVAVLVRAVREHADGVAG